MLSTLQHADVLQFLEVIAIECQLDQLVLWNTHTQRACTLVRVRSSVFPSCFLDP
jgi:hypothetical protein